MTKRSVRKKQVQTAIQAPRTQSKGISPFAWIDTRWKTIFQAVIIILSGLYVFAPTVHGEWSWDDDTNITANPLLHDPYRLWTTWFMPGHLSDYYPITQSLQWLQFKLWGDNPLGYHLTNILLHLINALLVWKLFYKFGAKLAWFGGLIFAIHPLTVESVAWVSELKNTLSLAPFLLAMCSYIDYDDHKHNRDYWTALGLFVVALLCKVSMALFPAIILLFAWWKRQRIDSSTILSVVPFLICSLVVVTINIYSEIQHAILNPYLGAKVPEPDVIARILSVGAVAVFYLWRFLYPIGLLTIYPHFDLKNFAILDLLSVPFLAALTFWFWKRRQSWGRSALLGLLFFLINLGPLAGFILFKFSTMTWSLDHLLYIPIIGLIGIAVAFMDMAYQRALLMERACYSTVVLFTAVALALLSHRYATIFSSQVTLWAYTVQNNPESWQAHENLGAALATIPGKLTDAITEDEISLRIAPNNPKARNSLGVALSGIPNRGSDAIAQFEDAIQLNPRYADAYGNLGTALEQSPNRLSDALAVLEIALRLKPDSAEIHNSYGIALSKSPGRIPDAIQEYKRALLLDPNCVDAHINLGIAFSKTPGGLTGAITEYNIALGLDPNSLEAHYDLARVLLHFPDRRSEAITQLEDALRIAPNLQPARQMLEQAQTVK